MLAEAGRAVLLDVMDGSCASTQALNIPKPTAANASFLNIFLIYNYAEYGICSHSGHPVEPRLAADIVKKYQLFSRHSL